MDNLTLFGYKLNRDLTLFISPRLFLRSFPRVAEPDRLAGRSTGCAGKPFRKKSRRPARRADGHRQSRRLHGFGRIGIHLCDRLAGGRRRPRDPRLGSKNTGRQKRRQNIYRSGGSKTRPHCVMACSLRSTRRAREFGKSGFCAFARQEHNDQCLVAAAGATIFENACSLAFSHSTLRS